MPIKYMPTDINLNPAKPAEQATQDPRCPAPIPTVEETLEKNRPYRERVIEERKRRLAEPRLTNPYTRETEK